MNIDERLALFEKRMQTEKVPDIAIETFKYYYTQLVEGHTGFIHASEIQPVEMIPSVETLPQKFARIGQTALANTVIIRLNGGLGTSMGLDRAKSLLQVKENLSFLDIIAHQAMELNIPLVLMNSFVTRDDSLTLLRKYLKLWNNKIDLDFLQHKMPKIGKRDLSPVIWPQDPRLEWYPPGHGNIYAALVTSGMLNQLLKAGFKYAFISNSDNLGAVMDTSILGYLVETKAPVLMEVADRTEVDKKGGFPVYSHDGQLLLWETAQCPPEELDAHQNIQRFKYFNANSLWINLLDLREEMQKNNNNLHLPMIRNEKTIDPADSNSMAVYLLETAMGSLISVFKDAQLVRIPRNRFNPVKLTSDLLAVRSDAYILTSDYRLIMNPNRQFYPPIINLDSKYYGLQVDMESRFPMEVPSLLNCRSLKIDGDIKFGENVVIEGDVQLVNTTKKQVMIENLVIADRVWQI